MTLQVSSRGDTYSTDESDPRYGDCLSVDVVFWCDHGYIIISLLTTYDVNRQPLCHPQTLSEWEELDMLIDKVVCRRRKKRFGSEEIYSKVPPTRVRVSTPPRNLVFCGCNSRVVVMRGYVWNRCLGSVVEHEVGNQWMTEYIYNSCICNWSNRNDILADWKFWSYHGLDE